MKRLLVLLLTLVMVVSIVGCKKTEKTNTSKVGNKVLTLVENENISSLITWKAIDAVSFNILGNVLSGLYTLDTNQKAVPDLAESVNVSEDGLTYTFKIKKGIKWVTVDGKEYAEVTADDFVFAWKKLLDPKEAAQYSFMIGSASIKGGKEAVALTEEIGALETAKKDLKNMKLEDFKEADGKTPQQLFDKAKAEQQESIQSTKDKLNKKYGSLEKANSKLKELIDSLAVEAVDKYTLKVELSNPTPFFIDLMAFPSFYPASKAFCEEKGDKYGTSVDNFLFNGPFIMKEWKISERHYMVKNDKHWDAENVKLDAVDWRVVEGGSNDTKVNMYTKGDIMRTYLKGPNVEKYANRPDATTFEDPTIFYLEINQGKGKPTSNKRLLANKKARKAINLAINKKYITNEIEVGSATADYFVPKNFAVSQQHGGKTFREVAGEKYNAKEGYNSYNVEKAKKLWEEAKKETGISEATLNLIIYQREESKKIGQHIQNELQKNLAGVKVTVEPLPFSEKLERANKGDFELNWAGWGPDYPDAMTFMDLWVTNGGHNYVGYSNPEYDKAIQSCKSGELAAKGKEKERFEKLVELEKTLIEEDQVIVPLYQRILPALLNKRVKNMVKQSFGPDYIFKWMDIVEE